MKANCVRGVVHGFVGCGKRIGFLSGFNSRICCGVWKFDRAGTVEVNSASNLETSGRFGFVRGRTEVRVLCVPCRCFHHLQ